MEEKRNGLRVILFPLPLQGCINPMLQLANILHSKGFSITVIHTRFNAPRASSHPLFTFLQISDGLSESQIEDGPTSNVMSLLAQININAESPFRDCLSKVLLEQPQESERVSCLIDDCGWLFTQTVSESLNLPRMVLCTFKATFFNAYPTLPLIRTKGYLPLSDSETGEEKQRICCLIDDSGWMFTQPIAQSLKLPRLVLNTYKVSFFRNHFVLPQLRREGYLSLQDSKQEDLVQEFPPLRKKDVLRILDVETELLDPFLEKVLKMTKVSSGLISMSCEVLDDQDTLSQAREDFDIPIFAIGPSHIHFPASSSSLSTPDETCIPWLDKQEDKSVIYVSFGSIVTISESEFTEIVWGLRNSNQPFLWVLRVGSVRGTEWVETIPEEIIERLNEKGKIVKWAPQQDVLKHRAIGGFLTHNGWSSTVESVCEAVPMICLPFRWDQMLNARFVSDVWMVGIHLEGRVERNEIEGAIRRLLLEAEGQAIRERIQLLKEKIGRSCKQNGSAYQSLQNLIDYISSF